MNLFTRMYTLILLGMVSISYNAFAMNPPIEETASVNYPIDLEKASNDESSAVQPLALLCVEAMAKNIQENIDTQNPKNDLELVQEIIKCLEDYPVYAQYFLNYFRNNTQPTWKCIGSVNNHLGYECVDYRNKSFVYCDSNAKIGIIDCENLEAPKTFNINDFLQRFDRKVNNLIVSPNEKLIAVSTRHQCLIFYKDSYEKLLNFTIKNNITKIIFTHDSKKLIMGDDEGIIQIILLDSIIENVPTIIELSKHISAITALAVAPNSLYFVSSDNAKNTYIWTATTDNNFIAKKLKIDHLVEKICINQNSSHIVMQNKAFHPRFTNSTTVYNVNDGFAFYYITGDILKITKNDLILSVNLVSDKWVLQFHSFDGRLRKTIKWLISTTDVNKSFDLEDNTLLYSIQTKDSYSSNIYLPVQSNPKQLLYKLAIELALQNGYDGDLLFLKNHEMISLFEKEEQDFLIKRIDFEINNFNQKKIIDRFIDLYLMPDLHNNEPLNFTENYELLKHYSEMTRKNIINAIKNEVSRYWQVKYISALTLLEKLEIFRLPACSYLCRMEQTDPFEAFDSLINIFFNAMDFKSLKIMQNSNVKRLLKSKDNFITTTPQEAIKKLKSFLRKFIKKATINKNYNELLSLYRFCQQKSGFGFKRVRVIEQNIKNIIGEEFIYKEAIQALDNATEESREYVDVFFERNPSVRGIFDEVELDSLRRSYKTV